MPTLRALRLLAAGAVFAAPIAGQEGLLSFRQALLDASVDTRVVVVVTHPDDRYRGLSLLLRRQWGADVTVLIATRGEGGQNAIGPELGAALGAIRTLEAVRAAQDVLDVKLRFLDLPDFGYSRTAGEALDRWRGDRPFARLRDELDDLDADLIITPHRPSEAHGQKRAVLHLLRRYMREKKGRKPRFFRHAAEQGEPADLVLDLDRPDPERGRSYREEAYRALQKHRTQRPHLPLDEAIDATVELKSESGSPSLLEGLRDVFEYRSTLRTWLSEADAEMSIEKLQSLLEDLPQVPKSRELMGRHDPTTLSIDLLNVMQRLRKRASVGADVWRRLNRRVEALERAVLAGAVARLRWEGPARFDRKTNRIAVPLRIWNGGDYDLVVRIGRVSGPAGSSFELHDRARQPLEERHAVRVASKSRAKADLWLVSTGDPSPDSAHFDVALALEVVVDGKATIAARLTRSVEWRSPLTMRTLPGRRFLVPQRGGRVRMMVEFEKPVDSEVSAVLMRSAPFGVSLMPESDRGSRPIAVSLPSGVSIQGLPIQIQVAPWRENGGGSRAQPRLVRLYLGPRGNGPAPPAASCEVLIDPVPIRIPAGLRIGIVRGPDDTVEGALRSLGLDVQALEPDTLAQAGLDDFDTVLIDSRALLHRARDLKPQVHRFVSYAERGGHLVVLYHKAQEFNVRDTGVRLAPFPLRLGTERVTREDAHVQMVLREHPLMTRPNRIEPRDWDGWVQDRGLYFAEHGGYDGRYQEVLQIREPSMTELAGVAVPATGLEFQPQRGALLAAKAGRGSYVYCALVIHRQLAVFHPGAARLLVNLITPPSWSERRLR